MNIKATIDGVEQEFEVVGSWGDKTHFLTPNGIEANHRHESDIGCVALRLIRPRHTFGGVVYEETGEKRNPVMGEPLMHKRETLDYKFEVFQGGNSHSQMVILRPVALDE